MGCTTIGIPRGLFYYYLGKEWEAFFKYLGLEVLVSPPTSREILDMGVSLAPAEACLPVKVYYGHAAWLAPRVDALFVPQLVSLEEKTFICPKMMGLPDMIRPVLPSSTLLSPVINCREKGRERESLKEVARFLGKKEREVREASLKAQEYRRQWEASWRWGDHKKKGLKVGVLGHAYILQDPYGGRGMVQKIVE